MSFPHRTVLRFLCQRRPLPNLIHTLAADAKQLADLPELRALAAHIDNSGHPKFVCFTDCVHTSIIDILTFLSSTNCKTEIAY